MAISLHLLLLFASVLLVVVVPVTRKYEKSLFKKRGTKNVVKKGALLWRIWLMFLGLSLPPEKFFFSWFFVWFFVFFCFVYGCFESRSGYKDRPIRRFSPSPSVVWRSVLWPGDWRFLLLCFFISAPFTESIDRLGRRLISLQSCQSGNRTRATQLELTLIRAPYPLDQRSFPRI